MGDIIKLECRVTQFSKKDKRRRNTESQSHKTSGRKISKSRSLEFFQSVWNWSGISAALLLSRQPNLKYEDFYTKSCEFETWTDLAHYRLLRQSIGPLYLETSLNCYEHRNMSQRTCDAMDGPIKEGVVLHQENDNYFIITLSKYLSILINHIMILLYDLRKVTSGGRRYWHTSQRGAWDGDFYQAESCVFGADRDWEAQITWRRLILNEEASH